MSVKTNNEAIITGQDAAFAVDRRLLAALANELVIIRRHEDALRRHTQGVSDSRERLIDIATALLE